MDASAGCVDVAYVQCLFVDLAKLKSPKVHSSRVCCKELCLPNLGIDPIERKVVRVLQLHILNDALQRMKGATQSQIPEKPQTLQASRISIAGGSTGRPVTAVMFGKASLRLGTSCSPGFQGTLYHSSWRQSK